MRITYAMNDQNQLEFLHAAKNVLNVTWDELAEKAGINPRALKTYRMPSTSKDHRTMPSLAKVAVQRLVESAQKARRKSA